MYWLNITYCNHAYIYNTISQIVNFPILKASSAWFGDKIDYDRDFSLLILLMCILKIIKHKSIHLRWHTSPLALSVQEKSLHIL